MTYNNELYNKLTLKMQETLSEKRFMHSLGVSYTAASLAMRYDENIDKARIAGILHDCAKNIKAEEYLDKCNKYGIEIRDVERQYPELLHAKLGSFYAHHKYNIDSEDILAAIKWHTTGHENMTLLEKIIYISDYIEPMRNMDKELNVIRKEAFSDIDKCLVHILKNTLNYITKNNKIFDDYTKQTYDYYANLERTING